MSATRVELVGLTKRYSATGPPQVDAVNLTVEPGSLTAVLGPSGCGKTTTLKVLAGLLEPTAGDVLLDGRSVARVPAERRGTAMVFQKPLLFPHMSVGDNVGFGLRMRGVAAAERRRRTAEMLELVRLGGYESRRATELSGGQEQRVSLARALVVQPRVLLLDEPLSQLDASLRTQMRELVRGVQQEVGVTTVLVTHDQEEAVVLADRIGLMLDGRIVQEDRPEAFYERPASVAVARFFGTSNLLPGTVRAGTWSGPLGPVPAPGVADGPALLVVRQESLVVDAEPTTAAGAGDAPAGRAWSGVAGVVVRRTYLGTAAAVQVDVAGQLLHAVVPPTRSHAPGDPVRVLLPAGAGHVVSPDTHPHPGGRA